MSSFQRKVTAVEPNDKHSQLSNLHFVIDASTPGKFDKHKQQVDCQLSTMGGENLFNVFGPTAISLQIFGTSPITLHRDPKKSGYHVSVVGVAYISVLIGFLAYCGYIAVYHGLGLVVQIGQLVVLILHIKIRVILGSICAVVLLATSITKAPTLCRVISGFNEFSTALPHHFTPLFYRSTFFGSITVLIIFVFVSLIQLFVEFENVVAIANGNLSSLYLWSFFVSWVGFDIVSWAVITQLLIYSGMLYYQFRALEIEVAGDLRKANSWKSSRNSVKISTNAGGFLPSLPKNLKNLRHLHTHLTCNAAELNQVFATQILVFITCNTILLCFSLFVLLQNLDQHGDAPPIHVSTLWFCIRIFPIYLAICPFSCIENKVSRFNPKVSLNL